MVKELMTMGDWLYVGTYHVHHHGALHSEDLALHT